MTVLRAATPQIKANMAKPTIRKKLALTSWGTIWFMMPLLDDNALMHEFLKGTASSIAPWETLHETSPGLLAHIV